MDKFPWEESSREYEYDGYRGIFGKIYKYKGIEEYLTDSSRYSWRKGDIVKFKDGFVKPIRPDWRDWFIPRVTRKQKEMNWFRNPDIPRYADNQLAIIIGRYRRAKFKWRKFTDYGVVIMMLTGVRTGHTRHYWGPRPFKTKVRYPKKIKFKYLLKTLPTEVVSIYNKEREDTNESRNEMLHKIYKIFH